MILLIHPNFSSFVKADYNLLKKHFTVKTFFYHTGKDLFTNFFSQIYLFVWLSLNILNARNIYIWFADYHSFLPVIFSKIFRKNSIVILGGYDVTYLPDLNYGSFSNPVRSFFLQ